MTFCNLKRTIYINSVISGTAISIRTNTICGQSLIIITINIPANPPPQSRHFLENIRISEIDPQLGNIVIVDSEIKGQAAVTGQARDLNAGGGPVGQRQRLAECAAVHVVCGTVFGVKGPVEAGAVRVIAVKVLEAQGIGVIRYQLVIDHVIAEDHSGHFVSAQGGAVAPVRQLVVIDVGYVTVLFVMVDGIIIGVIDRHEGGRILHVHQVIFIRAVVYGDIVPAVVLVIIEIVLGIIVFGELVKIVVVCGIVVVPGLEIRAVGVLVADVIGRVLIQKIGQLEAWCKILCKRNSTKSRRGAMKSAQSAG